MEIIITSFSFRRGLPPDAHMVFDARFLKNPFYDAALTASDGRNAAVGAHIETDPDFVAFFDGLTHLIAPLLPRFQEKNREEFIIAVGCTGGRHRSVYVAQKLGAFLEKNHYKVTIRHRDLGV